jgi:2-(1,2-epoxy-1,2-dihydrophenyl)acetyl-CoA isomerase
MNPGGREIGATEALALGLVGEVAPPAEILDRAFALADELARGPRLAMRITRDAIRRGADTTLEEALDLEYAGLVEASAHPDATEGARAFVEKRPPRYA